MASIDKYERVGRNLYKYHGTYYRLYAQGTTHNRLWLIYPKLVELIDIDASTGRDILGDDCIVFELIGTVNADGREYIKYSKN